MGDIWSRIYETIFLKGIPVQRNEPMKYHTTIRIGGPVQLLVKPFNVDSLRKILEILKVHGVTYRILGQGSNLLVADEKLDTVVISTEYLDEVEFKGTRLIVGAGLTLARAIHIAMKQELSGLEFAAGIPGSVGGAVVMNAGAFEGCMADVVEKVEAIDKNGRMVTLSNSEMNFGYRTSLFRTERIIITSIEMKLSRDDISSIRGRIEKHLEHRFKTQPLEYPSAGSVFKRPMKDFYVGKAIESLGLKGLKIGGAMVSPKHAGFIINVDNASFRDVVELMELIQRRIEERFHVKLEREVEIWNV